MEVTKANQIIADLENVIAKLKDNKLSCDGLVEMELSKILSERCGSYPIMSISREDIDNGANLSNDTMSSIAKAVRDSIFQNDYWMMVNMAVEEYATEDEEDYVTVERG